jgi:hypothetical protein
MVSLNRLQEINAREGIEAAFAANGAEMAQWVGDDSWRSAAEVLLQMHRITGEEFVRVNVGSHNLILMSRDQGSIGLCFQKRHDVGKSVLRLGRQLLRDSAPPVAATTH